MTQMTFKYQKQIENLLNEGLSLPPLHSPNEMEAFRFAFAGNNPNNHKPVCIQNPSRRLPDNQKLSGYARSCFNGEDKAENT